MNVMMMIEDDDSVSFPKQALQTPLNCRLIPSEFVLMPVMPMTLPSVVCSRSKVFVRDKVGALEEVGMWLGVFMNFHLLLDS